MCNVPSCLAAPTAIFAVLLALAAPAGAQTTGSASASDAFAISASFTALNMTTALGPVLDAAGSAPPAYDVVKSRASFSQSVAVPPLMPATGVAPVAAQFTATATGLRSEAKSAGIELDFVQATGNSRVASANLQIDSVVPPGSTIPVINYLNVTATKVATSATYSQQFPLPPGVAGTTSFGSLSIAGQLLGSTTVTYAGSAPPNTVLYESPTVTITAHQQIVVGAIDCAPGCAFTPNRITVRGLDINLNKAVINGFNVTGDIVLGEAAAQ